MADIKGGWWYRDYWACAVRRRKTCSLPWHWWIIETRQMQTEKTNVWRWEEASEQAEKRSPEVNLQEWMNTCHVPQRVTEYGRPADCFSKSGFASFPLVLLGNEKHSSPRGCAEGKWKEDKCIYSLWWHSEPKKNPHNKACSRAWKGSIIMAS